MKAIGWRKLALGVGVLAATFAFIYTKTEVVGTVVLVPDIPANARDIVLGVFFAFVGGNVAGKFAGAKGSKEPS